MLQERESKRRLLYCPLDAHNGDPFCLTLQTDDTITSAPPWEVREAARIRIEFRFGRWGVPIRYPRFSKLFIDPYQIFTTCAS